MRMGERDPRTSAWSRCPRQRRPHRRFLVNLNRMREVEQGFKGSLFLHTNTRTHESIPVARRHMPDVRAALGLQAHGGAER